MATRPWRVSVLRPTARKRKKKKRKRFEPSVRVCVRDLTEGVAEKKKKKEGGGECAGNIPSSFAPPCITLLSQLQTRPQCGASLLKSQHDKNSCSEVARPTFPKPNGRLPLQPRSSRRTETLEVGSLVPQTLITPMIGCPGTQTLMSCSDTQERVEPRLASADARPGPPNI